MKFIRKNVIRFLSLTAVLLLAANDPALAQQEKTMQKSAEAMMQNEQISDAKIEAYAVSAYKISQIHSEMAPKIKAAQNNEEKNAMYVNMQKKMVGVLQKSENITLDEYNAISQAAQNNPQLASRIRTEFKTMQQ